MQHFKNAKLEMWPVDAEAMTSRHCDVRLANSGEIKVSYEDEATDDGSVSYEGKEQGEGHYLLDCVALDGLASLHRFSDSLILEGYWEAGEAKGMWRIELGKVVDTVSGDADLKPIVKSEGTTDVKDEEWDDDLLLEAEEEEEEDDWASKPRLYRFPLRSDWDVRMRLPDDMTKREGKRMAAFVKSLSHCD